MAQPTNHINAGVHPPVTEVRSAVQRALAEDLIPLGDVTSALLPQEMVGEAHFVPRVNGVLAGRMCAVEAFRFIDETVTFEWSADDGDEIRAGEPFARVRGRLVSVLTAERTALNFMTLLSGVATATRRFVDASGGEGAPPYIRCTRKTTPGLRSLEKAAVRAGGGRNHRGSLSDGVLLKDNHLAGLGIVAGVERARAVWPTVAIEVECDRVDQVRQAVEAGADAILLDNMTPEQAKECVGIVDGRCLVEVSGGVTLETVKAYKAAGVDLISVGALTHSAPSLDIGLDLAGG